MAAPTSAWSVSAGYVRIDYVEAALAWQRAAESPEPAPGKADTGYIEPSTASFRGEVLPTPRMHKVYLGCLENKGGFRPIRDSQSKWFISEGSMPDSKASARQYSPPACAVTELQQQPWCWGMLDCCGFSARTLAFC